MTEEPRMSAAEYRATLKPHPDSIGRHNYFKFAPEILDVGLVGEIRIDKSTASPGKYTGRTEDQDATE